MYKASVFRYFIALVLVGLLLVPTDCFAQQKEIVITVKRIDGGKIVGPWRKARVFGFNTLVKAHTFERACEDSIKNHSYFIMDESMYDLYDCTDEEGVCVMSLPPTGYIVVVCYPYPPRKIAIRGRKEIEVNMEMYLVCG